MPPITKPGMREIVDDFAAEIRRRLVKTAKPSRTVVNFRTEVKDGRERDVVRVPIELLRYRKDNGRIASDVLDYERNVAPLDERDEAHQAIIAGFLRAKDREKTDDLRQSIRHDGQRDPAIITCDGFLINGNRRRLVLEDLHKSFPHDDSFAYMKVVILPGRDEEGGPPTLLEIEKIENRYQLQSDGKAEYFGFDRALSIQRKIAIGLSLKEQLQDDPRYTDATQAELERALKKTMDDYLLPLACVDRYLEQFGRPGQYGTISTGMSDREGRWQAFIDYSHVYQRTLRNESWRVENQVDEQDVGQLEEAAFDIIRLRDIPNMGKVHQIVRDLPSLWADSEAKEELLQIADEVKPLLPKDECLDASGNPLTVVETDAKWSAANRQSIIWRMKRAKARQETKKESETPLSLLDAALKKLCHGDLVATAIAVPDLGKALKIAEEIRDRAQAIKAEIYARQKGARNGPSK